MQYGDKFQTRLTAINYGDWPLDGVTFTYVYPLGTMPELDDDDNPVIRDAQYGGALGDTDTATVGSIQLQTSAIILQRPDKDGSPVKKLDKDCLLYTSGRTCGIPSERKTDSAKTGGAE